MAKVPYPRFSAPEKLRLSDLIGGSASIRPVPRLKISDQLAKESPPVVHGVDHANKRGVAASGKRAEAELESNPEWRWKVGRALYL